MSVVLDGTGDVLRHDHADTPLWAWANATVSFWIKVASLPGGTQTIFFVGTAGAIRPFRRVMINSSGAVAIGARSPTGGEDVSSFTANTVNVGEWNHVVITEASGGSSRAIILNGGTPATNDGATGWSETEFRTSFGSLDNSTGGSFFAGRVAKAAKWSSILSGTDLATLADPDTDPTTVGSPANNWPFSADGNDTIGGRNFTAVGDATFDSGDNPGGGGESETPTPGGAIAGGNGPTTRASLSPGGAIAGGTSPLDGLVETPTPGGATAGGNGPTAKATTVIDGGLAGGAQPLTILAPLPLAGALAGGTSPGVNVSVTPGGATAGGTEPADSETVSETPTPGGATAGGLGPTANVTQTIGGAVAGGVGLSIKVGITPGGAIAGGNNPTDGSETELPDIRTVNLATISDYVGAASQTETIQECSVSDFVVVNIITEFIAVNIITESIQATSIVETISESDEVEPVANTNVTDSAVTGVSIIP